MKAVIIFSLFTQFLFSQQQQQQFLANNNSNVNDISFNNLGNSNFASNVQIRTSQKKSTVIQSQRSPVHSVRVRSINNISQINRINTIKSPVTAQVRRTQPRPRIARAVNNTSSTNNSETNNTSVNVNELMPVNQMASITNSNNSDVQIGSDPFSNEGNQSFSPNEIAQTNFNLDLSLNLKGNSHITRTSSSGSSHNKSHLFSKKFAKFKRNLFGKLASHKKSKHRLDVCFNWNS